MVFFAIFIALHMICKRTGYNSLQNLSEKVYRSFERIMSSRSRYKARRPQPNRPMDTITEAILLFNAISAQHHLIPDKDVIPVIVNKYCDLIEQNPSMRNVDDEQLIALFQPTPYLVENTII